MSHFLTAVIVPTLIALDPQRLDLYLEEVLEPFSENLEVEEYEESCHCVGRIAQRKATEQADQEYGTIDSLRESFKSVILDSGMKVEDAQKLNSQLMWAKERSQEQDIELAALDKAIDKAWRNHIQPHQDAEKRYFDMHPLKDVADPNCGRYSGERQDWWPETAKEGEPYEDNSGCLGTGDVLTTYNPQSKWDWYVIGGRWNDWLMPADAKEEFNKRREADFQLSYAPNGDYNIVSPNYILSLGLIGELPTPYSFVHDGTWNQRGEMGWWGISTNETDQDEWTSQWREVLTSVNTNDDYRVVVVDMHI
jgi:hypothetical protein